MGCSKSKPMKSAWETSERVSRDGELAADGKFVEKSTKKAEITAGTSTDNDAAKATKAVVPVPEAKSKEKVSCAKAESKSTPSAAKDKPKASPAGWKDKTKARQEKKEARRAMEDDLPKGTFRDKVGMVHPLDDDSDLLIDPEMAAALGEDVDGNMIDFPDESRDSMDVSVEDDEFLSLEVYEEFMAYVARKDSKLWNSDAVKLVPAGAFVARSVAPSYSGINRELEGLEDIPKNSNILFVSAYNWPDDDGNMKFRRFIFIKEFVKTHIKSLDYVYLQELCHPPATDYNVAITMMCLLHSTHFLTVPRLMENGLTSNMAEAFQNSIMRFEAMISLFTNCKKYIAIEFNEETAISQVLYDPIDFDSERKEEGFGFQEALSRYLEDIPLSVNVKPLYQTAKKNWSGITFPLDSLSRIINVLKESNYKESKIVAAKIPLIRLTIEEIDDHFAEVASASGSFSDMQTKISVVCATILGAEFMRARHNGTIAEEEEKSIDLTAVTEEGGLVDLSGRGLSHDETSSIIHDLITKEEFANMTIVDLSNNKVEGSEIANLLGERNISELRLDRCSFSEEDLITVGNAISNAKNLSYISTSKNYMSNKGARAFGISFAKNTSVKRCNIAGIEQDLQEIRGEDGKETLDLDGKGYRDVEAIVIGAVLKTNSSATRIQLTSNKFEKTGKVAIGRGIIDMPSPGITEVIMDEWSISGDQDALDLSKELGIDDGDVLILAGILKHNENVVEIGLRGLDISDVAGKTFAEAIEDRTNFESLDLALNQLGEETMISLTTMIERSEDLLELYVSFNEIGADGALFICEAAAELSLKVLSLAHCGLRDDAVDNIAASFVNHELVNLAWNKLSADGVQPLSEILTSPKCNIRVLNLSYNLLGDNGASVIFLAMKKNTKMDMLLLQGCGLYGDCINDLVSMLDSNETLRELNLKGNYFEDKGALEICRGLKNNSSLKTLSLRACGLTVDGMGKMVDYLETRSQLTLLDMSINDNQARAEKKFKRKVSESKEESKKE